jgi:hypothetical protein
LRSNLDPAGSGDPSGRTVNDSPDDWTRRMAEQYTMDSEHKALAAHVAGEADDAQGLGDNVELF